MRSVVQPLRTAVSGLAVVLIVVSAAANATELTLPTLLSEAARSHPTVRLKQSELDAARFDLDGARWSRYPSLGTELVSEQGGTQAVARIQQPLWTGGRIQGQIDRSIAAVSAGEAAVQEAQLSIMLEAASVFFESLRIQVRLDAARANESEHRRLLDIIERRVRAEVSPLTDATQARARLQQAISERLQFERQLDGLRTSLQTILGRPSGMLKPPGAVVLRLWDLYSLREAALRFSPQRRRLEAEIEVAQAQITTARSVLMPQVSLSYERKLGSVAAGADRDRVFLGVTMQTGAGLSALSGVDVAVARQQASRHGLEQTLRQLEQTVKSGWDEAQALEQQLQPSRALLAASDEVVDSYLRQFQVGRKTWLDVLNAQREKTNARYALADTEAPLQLARLRLLLLAGAIQPDSMTAILHD